MLIFGVCSESSRGQVANKEKQERSCHGRSALEGNKNFSLLLTIHVYIFWRAEIFLILTFWSKSDSNSSIDGARNALVRHYHGDLAWTSHAIIKRNCRHLPFSTTLYRNTYFTFCFNLTVLRNPGSRFGRRLWNCLYTKRSRNNIYVIGTRFTEGKR